MDQRVGKWSRQRRGRHARWAAGIVAAGLAVAACTSSSGVTQERSTKSDSGAPSTADVSEPSTPSQTGGDTGKASTEAPDPNGLPSLGDIDPEIVSGTLDNGLRYFIRNNDQPGGRVSMRLAINAGSGLQGDDQGGGAHFLEHMLFNGTEDFPENELVATLRSFGAAFGADVNAYTSSDETVYELTMPTADAAVVTTGLDVLEQWMTSATIDQDQVEAERGIVLDEWRVRDQSSNGRLVDKITELMLSGSSYQGRQPIGTAAEITSTDAAELSVFYDDWYRPDNAAVVVVGSVDPADIERQIIERFDDVEARGASPDRLPLTVTPSSEPQAIATTDVDLSEGFGFVTLPLSRDQSGPREAIVQRGILEDLAFDIVGTRLGNDALRGTAPFDNARADSSDLVRLLDSPEISFSADGADLEASTRAVIDEYERVRRFGFTQAEVDRAVASRRSQAQVDHDGRNSRQDASFADEYVRHVLEGESLPTADRWFEYVNEVLDRASRETIGYMFVSRYEAAGAHIFVAAPADEVDDLPTADELIAIALDAPESDVSPRAEDVLSDNTLVDVPDPVDETSDERLADGSVISFVEPRLLTFDNGVQAVFNTTPITDGVVQMEARSPGGYSALAPDDIADARAAIEVVEQSGAGAFDPVALEAFLSDKNVVLDADISAFTESYRGFAATSDLETLFQLIHLSMTHPRVDDVALEQYLDDELPFAEDPSIDPGYAGFDALLDARYADDERFVLPTVESLATVAASDVLRTYGDRFGDASDWTFSFSGDFDMDEAMDLARSYLATLPATGRSEPTDYIEPPPPGGVVTETVRAGEGEQASVTLLFTEPGTIERLDDIAARMTQQIVTARLTDTIREELGESYSPFGILELGSGPSPAAEFYLSISTGPELVDDVGAAVLAQLEDLRNDGPTDVEFAAAQATIANEVELFSNEQINGEILDALVDPDGNRSFDDFLRESRLVDDLSANDIRDALRRWAPGDHYIQVNVLPR